MRIVRALAIAVLAGMAVYLTACGGRPASAPVAGGTTSGGTTSGDVRSAHEAVHGRDMAGMAGMDMSDPSAHAGAEPATHGFKLNVPLPRPSFVLTDTGGRRFDFAARTGGRATLLYFGYTNCPYQCPTIMADIRIALRKVSPAVRKNVDVVFVTTDPEHDTAAVLKDWLGQIDPHFIGLTGSLPAVEAAQRAANVTVSAPRPGEKEPAGSASTAHGGGCLAYGTDDTAHVTYPAGTSSADLVRDLPRLVRTAHA